MREHCHSAFARKATLRAHIEKEHVQGDDIDMIAAALGFRPGLPVTPREIRNILDTPDDDVEEQSISFQPPVDLLVPFIVLFPGVILIFVIFPALVNHIIPFVVAQVHYAIFFVP